MPFLSARRFLASACVLCLAFSALPAEARSKTRGARLKPAPQVTYADGQTPAQRQRSE